MVVIGVTDEDLSLVDSWISRAKPSYPIAVLKTGAFEDALEVKGFPTVGIVGPGGELLYKGYKRPAMQEALDRALEGAQPGPVFPKKVMEKAFKYVADGNDSKAYAETLKQLGKATGEEAAWLTKYREYFEGRARDSLARAKELVEEGLVLRAIELLEPYAEAKPPYPSSAESETWLTELPLTMPTYKDELKGGAMFEKAAESYAEREFTDAVEAYVKVYKKYPETKIAEVARKRAEELVQKGLPGYRSSCTSCKQAGEACSKHAETVKL